MACYLIERMQLIADELPCAPVPVTASILRTPAAIRRPR